MLLHVPATGLCGFLHLAEAGEETASREEHAHFEEQRNQAIKGEWGLFKVLRTGFGDPLAETGYPNSHSVPQQCKFCNLKDFLLNLISFPSIFPQILFPGRQGIHRATTLPETFPVLAMKVSHPGNPAVLGKPR